MSSDFCHWGLRFCYTPGMNACLSINNFIRELDLKAIEIIKKVSYSKFNTYLLETGNTICGKGPINLLLLLFLHSNKKDKSIIELLSYSQSTSQLCTASSSSVSYASISFIETINTM